MNLLSKNISPNALAHLKKKAKELIEAANLPRSRQEYQDFKLWEINQKQKEDPKKFYESGLIDKSLIS